MKDHWVGLQHSFSLTDTVQGRDRIPCVETERIYLPRLLVAGKAKKPTRSGSGRGNFSRLPPHLMATVIEANSTLERR